MDYKDIKNKNELIKQTQVLTKEYQDLFNNLIGSDETYKKAALLYYWMRDYKNYVKNEASFDPNFYPAFERGNIVNLNLGFNLGAELGGLHYAVVLRDSNRKSPNLIVMPLISLKPGKDISCLRPTELFLGNELYYQIQGKYRALQISMPSELELLNDMLAKDPKKPNLAEKINDLQKKLDLLIKTKNKLAVLKTGSIVVLNQIRTISKMRLVDPCDKYDILFKIKLSSKNLEDIDARLIELFTKNKP